MSKLTIAIVSIACMCFAAPALAGDPRCESSKLKAWGKLRACENKERAAERLGRTPDFASCTARFDTALLKAGSTCRYVDNGDATVTDLDTGLMWQKTDDAGGLTDKDNVYAWSLSGTAPDGPAFHQLLAGLNACSSFDGVTSAGGFAGHCDWRLPVVEELRAIVDCTLGTSCFDESVFGPVVLAYYWTSSTLSGTPTAAWTVGGFGDVTMFPKHTTVIPVRAVRDLL